MTIDDAIQRYKNNAEYERTHGNLQGCLEFRQLAEWLRKYQKIVNIVSLNDEEFKQCGLKELKEILEVIAESQDYAILSQEKGGDNNFSDNLDN